MQNPSVYVPAMSFFGKTLFLFKPFLLPLSFYNEPSVPLAFGVLTSREAVRPLFSIVDIRSLIRENQKKNQERKKQSCLDTWEY